MKKEELLEKYGFEKDGNKFILRRYFKSRLRKEQVSLDASSYETYTIKDFNFLGIDNLKDIEFVVPRRTSNSKYFFPHELSEEVLFNTFMPYNEDLYGYSDMRAFWHCFLNDFIDDTLKENGMKGIDYSRAASATRNWITPFECLVNNGDEISIPTDNFELRIKLSTMFRLWHILKNGKIKTSLARTGEHSDFEMEINQMGAEAFYKGMFSLEKEEEVRDYYQEYKEKHFRYSIDGELTLYTTDGYTCIYGGYAPNEMSFVTSDIFHDNKKRCKVVAPVFDRRCYSWDDSKTQLKIINDLLQRFDNIEFKNNEEYTFERHVLKMGLIDIFLGHDIQSVKSYLDETCYNPIVALVGDKVIACNYGRFTFMMNLQTMCELWEYLGYMVKRNVQNYGDRSPHTIERLCKRLGISLNVYKQYRRDLLKCESGLEVASLLFTIYAKLKGGRTPRSLNQKLITT